MSRRPNKRDIVRYLQQKRKSLRKQLPQCKKCGGRNIRIDPTTFANGTEHYKAMCAQCNEFVKFVRPSKLPSDVRAKLSTKELRRAVRYPRSHSEFEVQAYVYHCLLRAGYDARGEVTVADTRSRFDIVVYRDQLPLAIIETKKETCVRICPKQIERYRAYGLPLYTIIGMKDAKKFTEHLPKFDSPPAAPQPSTEPRPKLNSTT